MGNLPLKHKELILHSYLRYRELHAGIASAKLKADIGMFCFWGGLFLLVPA